MAAHASVVIPCFNRERYIGAAIDSALDQGSDVEVVVVDDGSTDGSWPVIQSYGDRIRSVRTENRGVSAARNRGVSIASGQWIQLLDSDDRIPSGAVAERLEATSGLGPKQIALGRMALIDDLGTRIGMICPTAKLGLLDPADFLGAFVGAPLPFFPTHALRDVHGFDERFRNHEDHELVIRLLAAGYSFVGVATITCEARVHSGDRLSCDGSDDRFAHRLDALLAMTGTLVQIGVPASALQAHGQLLWTVGREAARAGQRDEAEALFVMARSVVGSKAVKGRLPVRIAQKLLNPYRAERLIERAKAIGRRLRD